MLTPVVGEENLLLRSVTFETTIMYWYVTNFDDTSSRLICCHQSRDIPTPGIAELPRDREKHIPGVVFGSSICWA